MAVEIFFTKKIKREPVLKGYRVIRYIDYLKVAKENELLQLKIETFKLITEELTSELETLRKEVSEQQDSQED